MARLASSLGLSGGNQLQPMLTPSVPGDHIEASGAVSVSNLYTRGRLRLRRLIFLERLLDDLQQIGSAAKAAQLIGLQSAEQRGIL